MSESSDNPEGRGVPWLRLPVLLFGLLVVYILSVGPVEWLHFHGIMPNHVFTKLWTTVYRPIKWLTLVSEFAADLLAWYYNLLLP